MKSFSLLLVTTLIFFSCSTPEKKAEPIAPILTPKLDYNVLEASVGINAPESRIGFREKTFDACDLGSALQEVNPQIKDCHHVYFVWVGFQLSCRESEESAQVLTEADLKPVSNQTLHWKMGALAGDTQTDFQGRAVIRTLSNSSVKKGYIRISTGVDFLNMKANDVSAIVTPPSWCHAI